MTVYVDDMYLIEMGKFGRMKMSHMIADSEEELHAMAEKVGLFRRWYQKDHYDVSMSRRTKAIVAGAVPITLRQLAAMSMLRNRDPNIKLASPENAMRLLAEKRESIHGADIPA